MANMDYMRDRQTAEINMGALAANPPESGLVVGAHAGKLVVIGWARTNALFSEEDGNNVFIYSGGPTSAMTLLRGARQSPDTRKKLPSDLIVSNSKRLRGYNDAESLAAWHSITSAIGDGPRISGAVGVNGPDPTMAHLEVVNTPATGKPPQLASMTVRDLSVPPSGQGQPSIALSVHAHTDPERDGHIQFATLIGDNVLEIWEQYAKLLNPAGRRHSGRIAVAAMVLDPQTRDLTYFKPPISRGSRG